jgi:hypothetical protein
MQCPPNAPYQRAHHFSHHLHSIKVLAEHIHSALSPVKRRDLFFRTVPYPLRPRTLLLLRLETIFILVPRVSLMHVGTLYAHAVYTRGSAVGARLISGAVILPPAAVAVDAGDFD